MGARSLGSRNICRRITACSCMAFAAGRLLTLRMPQQRRGQYVTRQGSTAGRRLRRCMTQRGRRVGAKESPCRVCMLRRQGTTTLGWGRRGCGRPVRQGCPARCNCCPVLAAAARAPDVPGSCCDRSCRRSCLGLLILALQACQHALRAHQSQRGCRNCQHRAPEEGGRYLQERGRGRVGGAP